MERTIVASHGGYLTLQERRELGREAARRRPAPDLADTRPRPDAPPRVGVVELLQRQAVGRAPRLVPIRHARMAVDAFTFLRGSAIVQAQDLGRGTTTDLVVQLCGDAHCNNFGLFASPERDLVFDLNDFDETAPGPFEWDLKRLAVSIALTNRLYGHGERAAAAAAEACARSFAEHLHDYAGKRTLDVWYDTINDDEFVAFTYRAKGRKRVEKILAKAMSRTGEAAIAKWSEMVDGERRFLDAPPTLRRIDKDRDVDALREVFRQYRASLQDDERRLLDRFRFRDIARRVVGVGSVGTRTFLVLLEGRDDEDILLLQLKQANPSVLEPWLPTHPDVRFDHEHHGHRVVLGQRLLQAASDIFLGWTLGGDGREYYVRQARDWKGEIDPASLETPGLRRFGELCGWGLARAQARAGDAVTLSGYIGDPDRFAAAIAEYACAYAEQVEEDYRAFLAGVEDGRLPFGPLR